MFPGFSHSAPPKLTSPPLPACAGPSFPSCPTLLPIYLHGTSALWHQASIPLCLAIRSSATPLPSLLDIGPQPPPGPHCSIQPSQDEHGFCPSDCGSASTQAMSGCSPSPFRLGNGALIASVGIFAPEAMGQRLWRFEWNGKAASSPLFCFALSPTTSVVSSGWVLDGTRTMRTL